VSRVEDADSGYRGGDVKEAHDSGFAKGRLSCKQESFDLMMQVAQKAFEEGRLVGWDEGYEAALQDSRNTALKRWVAA
jgi:hypothetical protein